MTTCLGDERAEPKAKAALLEFLRDQKLLSARTVVTSELVLEKQAVRADIFICDKRYFHCFEIKTEKDNLLRLDRQLEVYSRHANFITVVAATRHINAVLSRVASHVGIYEMVGASSADPIRVVRDPKLSPDHDPNAMLSILPVRELQTRLAIVGRQRREDVVARAFDLPNERKQGAALSFFVDRYGECSREFVRATRGRRIRPIDVAILRRWPDREAVAVLLDPQCNLPSQQAWTDDEVFEHIGKSFGPVPDELKQLLAG